jgi:predicted house-cleaning noncanonical NTP pyrophosphatase (MazG superfamily)
MAEFNGFTLEEILKEAQKKKLKNGGFNKRIFLEKVLK